MSTTGSSMGKALSIIQGKLTAEKQTEVNDGNLTTTPDPNNRLRDQILGTIYGNCIGDAIGLMTEFLNKEQATRFFGGKHLEYPMKELTAASFMHQMIFPEADWTDDSDQMILIFQSLMDNAGQANAVDFASKLLRWLQQGFPELGDTCGMGVGRTTWKVINNRDYRTDPHQAALNVWEESDRFVAPNGGVMRTSIVGVHRHDDIEEVIRNTKVFCKVTHADPRCVASCVAVTTAISMMLQGMHRKPDGQYDVASLTNAAFEYAKECLLRDEEGNLDSDQVKQLEFHMNASLPELELDDKNKIGYTFKCLGAGFWALRQDTFRDAIEALTLEGGDADTNGAVAGALLGCRLGASNLPPSWRDKLKHKKWLDDIIERYFKMDIMLDSSGTPVDGPESGPKFSSKKSDKEEKESMPGLEGDGTVSEHKLDTDRNPESSEEVKDQSTRMQMSESKDHTFHQSNTSDTEEQDSSVGLDQSEQKDHQVDVANDSS